MRLFQLLKDLFKKPPPQRVRWIETRGCMAQIDYKVEWGTVIGRGLIKSYGLATPKDSYKIQMDNGEVFYWPVEQFFHTPDGVLEYKY